MHVLALALWAACSTPESVPAAPSEVAAPAPEAPEPTAEDAVVETPADGRWGPGSLEITRDDRPWQVVQGDGFAFAMLQGRRLDSPDELGRWDLSGVAGLPVLDGNLSQLSTGMRVAHLPLSSPAAAYAARVDYLIEKALDGEVDLAAAHADDAPDDAPHGLTASWRHRDGLRVHRSTYVHRWIAAPDGGVFELSAWSIGGDDDAGRSLRACGVVSLLQAHVATLVPAPDALDTASLEQAWSAWSGALGSAIGSGWGANKQTIDGKHAEAIPTFERTLSVCDDLAFAHNGLAWALAHVRPPRLEEARQHADRAVALTDAGDPSALDTLATIAALQGDDDAVTTARAQQAKAVEVRKARLGVE